MPGFESSRDPMVVRLRRNSDAPDEGIYRCGVNDATETPQTVYVGLYNTEGGMYIQQQNFSLSSVSLYLMLSPQIHISGQITLSTLDPVSNLNKGSPQFILTCISAGGPATTVTWTRDSTTTVTEGTETVLDDPETAQYTHTLNVTAAGDYTCTVANSAFSSSADITLKSTVFPACFLQANLVQYILQFQYLQLELQ